MRGQPNTLVQVALVTLELHGPQDLGLRGQLASDVLLHAAQHERRDDASQRGYRRQRVAVCLWSHVSSPEARKVTQESGHQELE
jgi:hypothetical protein